MSRKALFVNAICLVSLIPIIKGADPNFMVIECPNTNLSTTSTYAPNSTYRTNLNALLSNLSSNSNASNGFYKSTAGSSPPDVAYGLFLCRGDVSAVVCRDCVVYATGDTVQQCPGSKQVTIWYDECMLRYSNESMTPSILSVPGIGGALLTNTQNVTNATRLNEVLEETMSNYTKLDFAVLDISGRNYLSWILDVEIHLDAMELGNTITDDNDASPKDCAKAMIFIRHHLHEDLKSEYLTVKDPLSLWNNLKERYGHQKAVILPNARYRWLNLRLQDYKSVSEYNSNLFKIVSILKLCGEQISEKDMLEKTFSTFHANNLLLQQQYRERGFEKYSDLISCLLVAEQNNELLLRNHESRPTGALPFPEANRISFLSNGQGRGRGRRRGRGSHNHQVRGGSIQKSGKKPEYPQKWNKWNRSEVSKEKGKRVLNKPSKNSEDSCYRCGGKGHWSRTCRTPKHLIELYQASLKEKGKEIETNFTDQIGQNQSVDPFEPIDIPSFDISEYLAGPSGTKDDFFGDGGDYSEWSQE